MWGTYFLDVLCGGRISLMCYVGDVFPYCVMWGTYFLDVLCGGRIALMCYLGDVFS